MGLAQYIHGAVPVSAAGITSRLVRLRKDKIKFLVISESKLTVIVFVVVVDALYPGKLSIKRK